MSVLLESLSKSRTMVPSEDDRAVLLAAADIIRDRERVVTALGEPEVLILAGEGFDPATAAVDSLATDMEEALDVLRQVSGNLDDLRRLLRKNPAHTGSSSDG